MMLQARRDSRDSWLLTLSSILGYLLQLALNIFLARSISKAFYGDFYIGMKTFFLASAILLLGSGPTAKRILNVFFKQSVESNIHAFVFWNVRYCLRAIAIFLSLLAIFLLVAIGMHIFQIKSIETYHIALYLLFFTPLGTLAWLMQSYLKSSNHVILANFLEHCFTFLVLLTAFFFAVYFLDLPLNQPSIIAIFLLSFIAISLINVITTISGTIIKLQYFVAKPDISEHTIKEWTTLSTRMTLIQVVSLLTQIIDLYLVKFFGFDPLAVGEYASVLALSGILLVIGNSILSAVTPLISIYFKNDKPLLQEKITHFMSRALILNLILGVALIVFSNTLLSLFGESYVTDRAKIALFFFLFACFIRTAALAGVRLLVYSGYELFFLMGCIGEILALILLGIPLTLYFGIVGTSIAVAITAAAKMVFVYYSVKIKLQYNPLGFI